MLLVNAMKIKLKLQRNSHLIMILHRR